jgi:chemotaxis protein MotB
VNYAAARHLVPSPGSTVGGESALLPWETEADTTSARQETWLLSFIDILALLLTLFVLLLAYQDREPPSVTADTAAAYLDWPLSLAAVGPVLSPDAADANGFAMPGDGLLPLNVDREADQPATADRALAEPAPAAAEPPVADHAATVVAMRDASEEGSAGEGDAALAAVVADTTASPPVQPPSQPLEPESVSRRAADELLETFRRSALGERVEVTARAGAVSLEISDNILFTPASAALSVDGMALLEELAGVLRTLPYTLSVEGHTDDVPIQTLQYPSNWELSAARAAMVTRKLIEQGIAAERVRAIGYGDTRPRGDNGTPEGRAKNRRVTFILQVEYPPG